MKSRRIKTWVYFLSPKKYFPFLRQLVHCFSSLVPPQFFQTWSINLLSNGAEVLPLPPHCEWSQAENLSLALARTLFCLESTGDGEFLRGQGAVFGWTQTRRRLPCLSERQWSVHFYLSRWQASARLSHTFHFRVYELACMQEWAHGCGEQESENATTFISHAFTRVLRLKCSSKALCLRCRQSFRVLAKMNNCAFTPPLFPVSCQVKSSPPVHRNSSWRWIGRHEVPFLGEALSLPFSVSGWRAQGLTMV